MSGLVYSSNHNHTTYSLYDALGYPKDYFDYVLNTGGDSIAITDHGHMNSIGYVAAAAKGMAKRGVRFKALYGIEAYVIPSISTWRAIKEGDAIAPEEIAAVVENEDESKAKHYDPIRRRHHVVLYALNNAGLQNLFTLVSLSYKRENFYRFPRMDFDMLRRYNDGIAMQTACLAGLPTWCSMKVRNSAGQYDPEALWRTYDQELLPLLEIFGRDRAFLELQFNALDEQRIVNSDLIQYSKRSGYKLVVASDAHYCRPDLWKEREIYKSLGRRMMSKDFDASMIPQSVEELKCELYPHNAEQIYANYHKYDPSLPDADVRDAINRTHDIAWHLVGDVAPDATVKLPRFVPLSENIKTPFQQLSLLCREALKSRGLNKEPYVSRCVYELGIIKDKNAAAYFLTKKAILDCIRKEMLIGVGRGSGAGSLVNYLLDITQADPIKGGLLFERFMSPSRVGNPDIDSDCEDKERAFELLKQEFGEDNVLAISNYNRLGLKSLVKDVARLYDVPFDEVNKVTKCVETEARDAIMQEINHDQKLYELTYSKAYEHSPTFSAFIDAWPQVGECLEHLHKSLKTISRHAGGVLIVPDAERHLPIITVKNYRQSPFSEGLTAQHLEMFGLIKFDVLGLTTLRIIRRCIELILHKQGNAAPSMADVQAFYDANLHPNVINPADAKVFQGVYHAGRWCSIFQFAEGGVQDFCKKAQPNSVVELAAVTSLWRPGALEGGGDKKYLSFDPQAFKNEHHILQDVLGETRGVLILQEQFMQLAHKLADFSLDDADKLRKLLVKPSNELGAEMKLERQRAGERFIAGAIAKGMKPARAETLWHEEIMPFVSYGFNRAHAYVYAYESYQCAWLLTYHEQEWVKACLEKDPDLEKSVNAVATLGYTISKPDVNYSLADEWQILDRVCLPPLNALKGIGNVGAQELVSARAQEFTNLYDFFYEIDDKGLQRWRWSKFNKSCLQVLLKLEALDSLMCVGPDMPLKNYRHMHDTLFYAVKANKAQGIKGVSNFDKLKKGIVIEGRGKKKVTSNFTFEQLIGIENEVPDWTNAERIDMQQELSGIFDKGLLFSPRQRQYIEHNNLQPFTRATEGVTAPYWFFVNKVTPTVGPSGAEYNKVSISDGHESKRTINIFDDVSAGLARKLCVAKLAYDGEWLNVRSSIYVVPV